MPKIFAVLNKSLINPTSLMGLLMMASPNPSVSTLLSYMNGVFFLTKGKGELVDIWGIQVNSSRWQVVTYYDFELFASNVLFAVSSFCDAANGQIYAPLDLIIWSHIKYRFCGAKKFWDFSAICCCRLSRAVSSMRNCAMSAIKPLLEYQGTLEWQVFVMLTTKQALLSTRVSYPKHQPKES